MGGRNEYFSGLLHLFNFFVAWVCRRVYCYPTSESDRTDNLPSPIRLSVGRADGNNAQDVVGVVSTKPGQTLGVDDTSLVPGEKGYPRKPAEAAIQLCGERDGW